MTQAEQDLQNALVTQYFSNLEFFKEHDYALYPSTTTELIPDLKKVIDDYKARKITNQEVKDVIAFYAEKHPEKLYDEDNYNKTVKRLIGKRRLDTLDRILNDLD